MSFYFAAIEPSNPYIANFKTLTSSGSASFSRSISFTGSAASPIAIIANTTYSYQLYWTPGVAGTSHIFWGAQISYVNIVARFRAQ